MGPIVDVGYVCDISRETVIPKYGGIPYAEPPVGDLHFRAIVPLNTTRVYEENNFNVEAVVNATYYPGNNGSRLYVCVIAFDVDLFTDSGRGPKYYGSRRSKIRGLLKGQHIYSPYGAEEGDNLPINQSPNVIIVSVYCHLHSFGFLTTPESTDPTHSDFKVGFKNHVRAPEWVKSYSAGGSSVELHMIANEGEALFSGAIAHSAFRTRLPTPEQQQPLFQFYAWCGMGSVAEQMTCLRGASNSALAWAWDAGEIARSLTGGGSELYNTFHPVLGGVLITGRHTSKFQRNEFVHIPFILVGETSNETCSGRASRQAMGSPSSLYSSAWPYRYNAPNSTSDTDAVAHAAENWMLFDGTDIGDDILVSMTLRHLRQTPAELAFASELIVY
ncbi:alpha beta-hydrolase [Suillus placidus]|uniref:Alpha beta-hydrolase n=1 Tax=Suillus placidus TaxID=48579 RepID=A0A9P6ZTH1_9AGAM|nr:alpha beta-hydrolase [Suillus placidus]